MGRIKIKTVKTTGKKIFVKYSDILKKDFEFNKHKIPELAVIPSKKLRNQIAGYLVNLKKQAERNLPKYKPKKKKPRRDEKRPIRGRFRKPR